MNEFLASIPRHPSKALTDRFAGDPSVINLTVGEPDFAPPSLLVDRLQEILQLAREPANQYLHRYAATRGLPALRKSIADLYDRRYGHRLDPENNLLVTNGAAEAIWLSIFTLTNAGDEVLLPDPCYMLYEPITRVLGRRAVRIKTDIANGFTMRVKDVEAALSSKSRLLVINSPANPTGVVYSPTALEELARLAKESGICVVHDEVFDHCIYEGNHASIPALVSGGSHGIAVNSFSKTFGMTGWRLGWMVAAPEIVAAASKAHSYMCLAVPTVPQLAAADVLASQEIDAYIEANTKRLQERSQYFTQAISRIPGFDCPLGPPKAGFYVFVNVAEFYKQQRLSPGADGSISMSVVEALLDKCKVATVPGNAFGAMGEGFIRISFAASQTQLDEAMLRINESFGG